MTGKRLAGMLAIVFAIGVWWFADQQAPAESVDVRPADVAGPSDVGPVAGAPSLPESVPEDPALIDVPPAEAPGCSVEIQAVTSSFGGFGFGVGGSPVATRLDFGVSATRRSPGEPLRTVETDASGQARVELPWQAVEATDDGKRPWLWLRSGGPGLLTRVTWSQAPAEPGQTVTMTASIQAGVIVEGRILGPDGEPAAGRVNWWNFSDEGVKSSTIGTAGPDGLFSGELRNEGTHGLLARGTSDPGIGRQGLSQNDRFDLGTGFSEVFEVSFNEPVPFIEVSVSGPGVIQGRVLDAGGAPAASVKLLALVAELDDDVGSFRLPAQRHRELEHEGRGHCWVTMVTDGAGAFHIRGLRNDLYNIRAAEGDSTSGGYPTLLTPRPVPSHGESLELRLTRPHLAIHVRHADGSLPTDEFTAHRVHRISSAIDEWPEEPGLLVSLAPEDVHTNGWKGPYLIAKATGLGEFVVELDADVSVDLGVLGGALPWQTQRVDVPAGAGRVDVEVLLPEPVVAGSLVLDVVDSAGSAIVKQVRVRIVDPASGVVLFDKPCDYTDPEDWPLRVPLPEGEYHLRVEGHPWVEDHHGTHEQSLLISSGVETRITASVGAGARLSVRLLGTTTEADRQAIRDRHSGEVEDEYVDYWAPQVSLRLERMGRWPESPEFMRYWMEGTSAAGDHLFSTVEMGAEGVSEVLSPGNYTLVATTPGGRVVRRAVRFVARETLAVTLEFD